MLVSNGHRVPRDQFGQRSGVALAKAWIVVRLVRLHHGTRGIANA
jgi:hypothetical protein